MGKGPLRDVHGVRNDNSVDKGAKVAFSFVLRFNNKDGQSIRGVQNAGKPKKKDRQRLLKAGGIKSVEVDGLTGTK